MSGAIPLRQLRRCPGSRARGKWRIPIRASSSFHSDARLMSLARDLCECRPSVQHVRRDNNRRRAAPIIADFVAERDWSQFHSPKNVSMALAIEAAELMEHFQWLTTEASRRLADDPQKAGRGRRGVWPTSSATRSRWPTNWASMSPAPSATKWSRIAQVSGRRVSRSLRTRGRRSRSSQARAMHRHHRQRVPGRPRRRPCGPAIKSSRPICSPIADLCAHRRRHANRRLPARLRPVARIASPKPAAWLYTGALENHPDLIDQMAWIAPRGAIPATCLSAVRSPGQLADTFRAAGLLFPKRVSHPTACRATARGSPRRIRAASGSGVRELRRGARRRAGAERLVSLLLVSTSPCILSATHRRHPCLAVFVAADGVAALLGVTRDSLAKAGRWR